MIHLTTTPLLQELLPSSLLEQVKKKASDYEIVRENLTGYETNSRYGASNQGRTWRV